jgi:AcrR family transcriptional regulator
MHGGRCGEGMMATRQRPVQVDRARDGARTPGSRGRQAAGTREAIMATAERLFAEHGVTSVSSRQISEAAGQGNNAAVGYHFGTKADLIRAIVHRHDELIEQSRRRHVDLLVAEGTVREWVACLVLPLTEHMAAAGATSWYARFLLQLSTDPALREIIDDEVLASAQIARIGRGLQPCLAGMPTTVREERLHMVRRLLLHTCAERERALAVCAEAPGPAWEQTSKMLVDAIAGLLLAPVSEA